MEKNAKAVVRELVKRATGPLLGSGKVYPSTNVAKAVKNKAIQTAIPPKANISQAERLFDTPFWALTGAANTTGGRVLQLLDLFSPRGAKYRRSQMAK